MTKKFLSIFAILSIAAIMFLSSCTAAGVECGLIGKWEHSETIDGIIVKTTFEFTSDDKIIRTSEIKGKDRDGTEINDSDNKEFTIKSVSEHTIKTTDKGDLSGLKYRNLTSDSVEFADENYDNWTKFTKVY